MKRCPWTRTDALEIESDAVIGDQAAEHTVLFVGPHLDRAGVRVPAGVQHRLPHGAIGQLFDRPRVPLVGDIDHHRPSRLVGRLRTQRLDRRPQAALIELGRAQSEQQAPGAFEGG